MGASRGTWEPFSPAEAARELDGMPCRWWIAGGWAIDLNLGRQSRAHADGKILMTDIHDVWCRRSPSAPWSLQLMSMTLRTINGCVAETRAFVGR